MISLLAVGTHIRASGLLASQRVKSLTPGGQYVRLLIPSTARPQYVTFVEALELRDSSGALLVPNDGSVQYCGDDGVTPWVSGSPPFATAPCAYASSWGNSPTSGSHHPRRNPKYGFHTNADRDWTGWSPGNGQKDDALYPDAWLAYDFGATGTTSADIASIHVEFLTTGHSASGSLVFQESADGATWQDVATLSCDHCETADATVTRGTGAAQAKGDPHLVNVLGQRFDVEQPGLHVLARVPQCHSACHLGHALLDISGRVDQIGTSCKDMYFQEINVTGQWVEKGGHGPKSFHALKGSWVQDWQTYGQVSIKVARGTTLTGIQYLNILTRHLDKTGFKVGGLLGEDDHTSVAMLSPGCKKKFLNL